MRDYILNEQEIKEIIKTGKFLKEKYSNKLLLLFKKETFSKTCISHLTLYF